MEVGFITHEEATIQSFMRDPEFAEYALNDAIEEGDIDDIRTTWRRIQEAKKRKASQLSVETLEAVFA